MTLYLWIAHDSRIQDYTAVTNNFKSTESAVKLEPIVVSLTDVLTAFLVLKIVTLSFEYPEQMGLIKMNQRKS